ncbi:hypothetical protein [Haliovirga abyssi]|uniref:Uncharacterized protein n=1 Tax=Haliovirga abyssi TaxID=2996794 RepID=A0AAU9DC59_9FUSO|nr:hypothetical protein [Haliovirga abyssi]BDU51066.1 hypothetical protein HLVA_16350 [Haliovirga abyssi]
MKRGIAVASILIVLSFTGCTGLSKKGNTSKDLKAQVVKLQEENRAYAKSLDKLVVDLKKAKLNVKRVQSTYKKLMAQKVKEVEELKLKLSKAELKTRRVQNTYKKLMAQKVKEVEELKLKLSKAELKTRRVQNTYKKLMAQKVKEVEALKAKLKK